MDFGRLKETVSNTQILKHHSLMGQLAAKGDKLEGVCPLHQGTNPRQFHVSIPKDCWNCFGDCKRGDNILDFVSLIEDVSIREAAIVIADWFGIPDPQSEKERGAKGTEQECRTSDIPPESAQEEPVNEPSTYPHGQPNPFQTDPLPPDAEWLEVSRRIVSIIGGSRHA